MNIQYICTIECGHSPRCRAKSTATIRVSNTVDDAERKAGDVVGEAEMMARDVFRRRGWFVGTSYRCPKHAEEYRAEVRGGK